MQMHSNQKRIGTLVRAIVAVSLATGVLVTTAGAAQAAPADRDLAQEVVFSVSDGSSYEAYLVEECAAEPPCRIRRVPGQIIFRVTTNISLCCQNVTVRYATVNGSARAPEDYNAVSGTLTFAPGVFSKSVYIRVNEGGGVESTERFTLRLSNANVPADVSDAGVGTIRDGVLRL
jgi:hypothetical protein